MGIKIRVDSELGNLAASVFQAILTELNSDNQQRTNLKLTHKKNSHSPGK